MKKIAIICYYDLKEYLLHVKDILISYLYEVTYYPLYQYAYDVNDKKENYKEDLAYFIKGQKVDIVLWWFLDVPADVFKFVKEQNKNTYFIMHNSDDPCNINEVTFEKIKLFDMVISPCKEYITKYKRIGGIEKVFFLCPGYEPSIFYPCKENDKDDRYICDISIVCYNLYDDSFYNNQYIPKKKLLDDICAYADKNNKILKILGPEFLKERYGKYYRGDIEYVNKHKLYYHSKINIYTHPFCNKYLSLTGDEISIMGSQGLLLMDKIKGAEEIFLHMENCMILEKDTYIKQIDNILGMYDNKKDLATIYNIRKNAQKTALKYTWANWTKELHKHICEQFYDPKSYAELYDYDMNDKNKLKIKWLTEGIENKEIPYHFNVPMEFNADDYAKMNNFNEKTTSDKKLYLDWYKNGRNPDYINSKKEGKVNVTDYNTNMEQYYMICTALNGVREYKTRDASLKNLSILCHNNPRIKINNILKDYLALCDD